MKKEHKQYNMRDIIFEQDVVTTAQQEEDLLECVKILKRIDKYTKECHDQLMKMVDEESKSCQYVVCPNISFNISPKMFMVIRDIIALGEEFQGTFPECVDFYLTR